MQFYRYWTRSNETVGTPDGNQMDLISYGYSNQDLDDALRVARERAEANANRIYTGQSSGEFYYATAPLREEIVNELVTADGSTAIHLTQPVWVPGAQHTQCLFR